MSSRSRERPRNPIKLSKFSKKEPEKFFELSDIEPKFTMLDRFLVIIASFVMIVIFAIHIGIEEDRPWAYYSLMMFSFAFIGYLGTQLVYQRRIFEVKNIVSLRTFVRSGVILGSMLVLQIVIRGVLTITSVEQALYYIFAGVCEEVFFRVFILSIALRFDMPKIVKHVVNVAQAVGFALIHQNYYHDIPMMFAVGIGGLILGYYYILWRDATANILGHFLLNVIATGPMLIGLIL